MMDIPPPPPDEPGRPDSSRRALIAGLIAVTTFLGAIGAWRATEAGGAAAVAEDKALADERAAAQRQAVLRSTLTAIEFDYVRQTTHRALASRLRQEALSASTSPDDGARLIAEADAHDTAANAIFIDPDALTPEGVLDLEAKFDIDWELVRSQVDLDPSPEFATAEGHRDRQERIVGVTALFVAAALFLTLARVATSSRARNLYFAGGVGVLLTASGALLILELA